MSEAVVEREELCGEWGGQVGWIEAAVETVILGRGTADTDDSLVISPRVR